MRGLLSKITLFILLFFIVLNFNFQCAASDNTMAIKLIHVKGELFYSMDKGNTWKPVQDKKEFRQGVFLKTANNSEAAIMLKDGSQIRLNSNSILNIQDIGHEPGDEVSFKKTILNFFKGKLWFRNKRRTNKPDINSPVLSGSIRGTELSLEVKEDGASRFIVLEGKLLCQNNYGQAIATRGEEILSKKGKAPEIARLLNPEKSVQWLLLTPEIKGPGEKKIPLNAQKALNALMNNKIKKAFNLAENSVSESPGSASSRVILATCYQMKGQFEKGFHQALKAIQLDNNSAPALVRAVELGLGLNRLKQVSEMVNTFQGNRNDPVVIMLKGYIKLLKNKPLKAEKLFKQAINKRNDLSRAYLGLGLAQYKKGETETALKNIEYASLMNPLAAYPHNYLGKALLETGERKEAIAELKRASQLDPNDPTPYLYLAAIKADSFRPVAAIRSLQKAMELNNNRLVTRSRYLLDSDASVKNINMAWSLSQLGLYKWAKFLGDSALWRDQSNSSAYMFRAVNSISNNNITPATLGDSMRELLLKPVNGNTYITYSDYYSLMDQPLFKGSFTAGGGNNESGTGRLNFNGGQNKTAYSLDVLASTTDGVINGTGRDEKRGIINLKHSLNINNEFAFEFIAGTIDQEDTMLRQNGNLTPANTDGDIDYYSLTAGYKLKHGTNNHLLCILQTEKTNNDKSTTELFHRLSVEYPDSDAVHYDNLSNDNIINRIELTEMMKTGNHNLNFGAEWYHKKTNEEDAQKLIFLPDKYSYFPYQEYKTRSNLNNTDLRFYTRDIWYILPDFIIDYGLGWSGMDNIELHKNNTRSNRNNFLPSVGMIWDINKNNRLRAAWFKELESDYLNGSLQPVEVAGFSKALGTDVGALNENFAIGWDCKLTRNIFTSAEIYKKHITYLNTFNPFESESITWHRENRKGVSLACEQILTDQLALSLAYDFINLRTDYSSTKRLDNEIKASINWVHPCGLIVKAELWYVNQDEKYGYDDINGDSFITADLAVTKKFGKKKHSFFIKIENITDKQYLYLVREKLQSSQLPEQGRLIEAGLKLNF